MTERRYRLTEIADADISGILRYTAQQFGLIQQDRYAELIERAATMVATVPEHPSSRHRNELSQGVRSLHIECAAKRRGAASHILFYRIDPLDAGITILRALHESMDPMKHPTEPLD